MHKHEPTRASKCIENLENAFKNVQQIFTQEVLYIYHYIYISILFHKIISIYKHMSIIR
jgi:hypothetical protein